jgi:hypothetical protein
VDAGGKTKWPIYCRPNEIRGYIPCHASISCDSRPAALYNSRRAAGNQRFGSRPVHRQKRRGSRVSRLRHDQPTRNGIYQFRTRYPNQTFAGFIAAGSNLATDQRIATLQGKIIGITGTVELHDGKPEIKVTSASQIKGTDSQQAR